MTQIPLQELPLLKKVEESENEPPNSTYKFFRLYEDEKSSQLKTIFNAIEFAISLGLVLYIMIKIQVCY